MIAFYFTNCENIDGIADITQKYILDAVIAMSPQDLLSRSADIYLTDVAGLDEQFGQIANLVYVGASNTEESDINTGNQNQVQSIRSLGELPTFLESKFGMQLEERDLTNSIPSSSGVSEFADILSNDDWMSSFDDEIEYAESESELDGTAPSTASVGSAEKTPDVPVDSDSNLGDAGWMPAPGCGAAEKAADSAVSLLQSAQKIAVQMVQEESSAASESGAADQESGDGVVQSCPSNELSPAEELPLIKTEDGLYSLDDLEANLEATASDLIAEAASDLKLEQEEATHTVDLAVSVASRESTEEYDKKVWDTDSAAIVDGVVDKTLAEPQIGDSVEEPDVSSKTPSSVHNEQTSQSVKSNVLKSSGPVVSSKVSDVAPVDIGSKSSLVLTPEEQRQHDALVKSIEQGLVDEVEEVVIEYGREEVASGDVAFGQSNQGGEVEAQSNSDNLGVPQVQYSTGYKSVRSSYDLANPSDVDEDLLALSDESEDAPQDVSQEFDEPVGLSGVDSDELADVDSDVDSLPSVDVLDLAIKSGRVKQEDAITSEVSEFNEALADLSDEPEEDSSESDSDESAVLADESESVGDLSSSKFAATSEELLASLTKDYASQAGRASTTVLDKLQGKMPKQIEDDPMQEVADLDKSGAMDESYSDEPYSDTIDLVKDEVAEAQSSAEEEEAFGSVLSMSASFDELSDSEVLSDVDETVEFDLSSQDAESLVLPESESTTAKEPEEPAAGEKSVVGEESTADEPTTKAEPAAEESESMDLQSDKDSARDEDSSESVETSLSELEPGSPDIPADLELTDTENENANSSAESVAEAEVEAEVIPSADVEIVDVESHKPSHSFIEKKQATDLDTEVPVTENSGEVVCESESSDDAGAIDSPVAPASVEPAVQSSPDSVEPPTCEDSGPVKADSAPETAPRVSPQPQVEHPSVVQPNVQPVYPQVAYPQVAYPQVGYPQTGYQQMPAPGPYGFNPVAPPIQRGYASSPIITAPSGYAARTRDYYEQQRVQAIADSVSGFSPHIRQVTTRRPVAKPSQKRFIRGQQIAQTKRVFVVGSVTRASGCSSLAYNVACKFSETFGNQVLLIDLDILNPGLTHSLYRDLRLNLQDTCGIDSALQIKPEAYIANIDIFTNHFRTPNGGSLSFIRGDFQYNANVKRVLLFANYVGLISRLSEIFNTVVIDVGNCASWAPYQRYLTAKYNTLMLFNCATKQSVIESQTRLTEMPTPFEIVLGRYRLEINPIEIESGLHRRCIGKINVIQNLIGQSGVMYYPSIAQDSVSADWEELSKELVHI